MNHRILIVAIVLAVPLVNSAWSQLGNDDQPISVSELKQRPVIGDLGVPLGTSVKVTAEIVAGRDLGLGKHPWSDIYLLSVSEVDGVKLKKSVLFAFRVESTRVKLAANAFELRELKTGLETSSTSLKETLALERGYVGKTVSLFVYEEGRFAGGPRNAPADRLLRAEPAFHFSTTLVAMTEAK